MITHTTTGAADAFSIHTFSADAHGLCGNSHVISGPTESLMIDSQFLLADAAAMAALIKQHCAPLKQIFVTHAHPDHYFGLQAVLDVFPDATIVATAAVIADIVATFEAKRAFWLAKYGAELPSAPVLPSVLQADHLLLDGARIDIQSFGPAEGLNDCVAWFAPAHALFVGDLAYNREHAWMGEVQLAQWQQAIVACQQRFASAKHLYPGHGAPAGPELFAATAHYLASFAAAVAQGGAPAAIATRILEQFPDYGIPEFVHFGVAKWLQQ
jgi:glyoxylase-like metal-dependent hydrolase (beta-lactamase superfamily II)